MKNTAADPTPAATVAMAAALTAAFAAYAAHPDENHPTVRAAVAKVVALAVDDKESAK